MGQHIAEMRELRREIASAYRAGDYRRAVTSSGKLMQMYMEYGKSNTVEYAADVHNMAILFDTLGLNDKALQYYKEAAVLKRDYEGNSLSLANTLNNLAIAYSNKHDFQKALKFHQQALQIRDQKVGRNHADYIYSLYNLGNTYADLERFDKACEMHQKALEKAMALENFPVQDLADIFFSLGDIADKQGNYKKAISSYEFALQLMKKTEKAVSSYWLQQKDTLVRLYSQGGWFSLAAVCAEESLAMREDMQETEKMDYLGSLSRLAAMYIGAEAHTKAIEVYEKMLPYIQKKFGESHFFYAEVLNSIGMRYHAMEQYEKASQYILEGMKKKEKIFGVKSVAYAVSQFSFGITCKNAGKIDEALQQYLTILTYHKEDEKGDARKILHANALCAIGEILCEYGAYEAASDYEQAGLQIYAGTKEGEDKRYLESLYTLAEQKQKSGENVTAAFLCKKAEGILLHCVGENHPRYAWGLIRQGHILAEGKRYQYAVSVLEQAAKIQQEMLGADNPTYLRTLEELGRICTQGGMYDKALQYFLKRNHANLEQTREELKEAAETLLAVANCFLYLQNEKKAEAYYQEAEEKLCHSGMEADGIYAKRQQEYLCLRDGILPKKEKKNSSAERKKRLWQAVEIFCELLETKREQQDFQDKETIRIIFTLGDLYLCLGKANEALLQYEKAEKYAEGIQYVTVCRKIGEVYLQKGEAERALRQFHHAKSYMEEYEDVHTELYCQIIGCMGDCFYRIGDKDKALMFYQPYLHLFRELELPMDNEYAARMKCIAGALARRGEHQEAAVCYKELAMCEKAIGGETKEYLSFLLKAAENHIAQKDTEEAEKLLDKVLLRGKRNGTDTVEYGKLCDKTGRLYAKNGNASKAISALGFAYEKTIQGEPCLTKEGLRVLLQLLRENGHIKYFFAVKEGGKME